MMQHLSAGGVVCRVLGLALLGVVAVSTAGIVLPVLSFALLGYGIYGVFLYLWSGKAPQGWEKIPSFCKATVKKTWQVVSWPVLKVFQLVTFLVGSVFRLSWGSVKLGWMVGWETLGDAILGAAVGVLVGIPMDMDRTTVVAGAVIGGVIGFWSGLRRWWGPKKAEAMLTPLHEPAKMPALVPARAPVPRLVEC